MQADGQHPADGRRLSAAEVGQRVGEILDAAEREAREIIAAARHEVVQPAAVPNGAGLDNLARAIERLNARFDAFELSTAARLEELGRGREQAAAAPAPDPTDEVTVAASPEPEDPPSDAAARVRAIDLALAGYSREAIANELGVSMARRDVETLLDQVLAA